MIAAISPLAGELQARAESLGPVTVGLAGSGQMGTDLVVQLSLMPGLRLGAIAEINPAAARAAAFPASRLSNAFELLRFFEERQDEGAVRMIAEVVGETG